jgi:ferredoxin
MAFIVTEPCIKCRYTDCVEVCPVDCFHEGPNFLAIDPDECIDCGVCVPECPVDAIIDAADATGEQEPFIELNRELAALWPMINRKAEPAADADQWQEVSAKRHLLER